MESIYIPKITQYEPGLVEGGVSFNKDANKYDIRVSLVPVHPTPEDEVACFNDYSATVLLHPKTNIRQFAHQSPPEREDFRQKSHEYAGICASLAMMPWPNTDLVLVVDHAGELISKFVTTMRELPVTEVKREKIKNEDGTVTVSKVLLPENVDLVGKNIYILDEFIGSGYTLRIIIDELHKAGGRVNGIGVIATVSKTVQHLEAPPYNMIPIRTLLSSREIEEDF